MEANNENWFKKSKTRANQKFGDQVNWEIIFEKVAQQASGPPILGNLSKASKTFWLTESKNKQMIKKIKSEYAVPSNCEEFFSPS